MTSKDITPSPLVYNGEIITQRDEMISLTDMWRAAGADPQQAPAKWRALPATKAFVEAVSVTIGFSDSELFKVKNGGRDPGTSAHWQVGLAYAKYLSPDFHMWCNTVVRERMEGGPVVRGLTDGDKAAIGGIVKNCAGVVLREQLAELLPMLVEPLLRARLAEDSFLLRRGVTAKHVWDGAHLPPRMRGSTVWLGNRLAEMGCHIDGGMKGERAGVAVRLYDPDKASICMKNGLLHKSKLYASERMGQKSLRLVSQA